MKKNTRILVDIDGTLNDFQNHFFDTLDNMGYNYDYSKSSDYHMERGIKTKKPKEVLDLVFSSDIFWKSLPVLEGAKEGLLYLNNNYDVMIATTPWNDHNKGVKLEWMIKEFPFIEPKQVIFCHDKWELAGDIIIEDKPDTILKCSKKGMITITKTQPYNLQMHTDEFLNNWKDISFIMKKIETEHFFSDFSTSRG